MKRIIAVANQKGGVGKTTTTINLSASLAKLGQRVLAVDADPQGNTTTGLGLSKPKTDKTHTLYNILSGTATAEECLLESCVKGLFVLPSNIELAGAEIEMIDQEERENRLKLAIEPLNDRFDYVLVDCPPSLNLLSINALTAANTVLVPLQCEFLALDGLSKLLHTIELVKKKLNPQLSIEGVVFTMFDARTNLSMEVVEEVKKHLPRDTYKTIVPRNVRLSEAPSHGLPINMYDPKSKGAEAYDLLAREVIEKE